MKIYAKQVPPEYQESPLFMGIGCFPEDIALYGNRHYHKHLPPVFERVYNALKSGDLLEAWEDINDNGNGYYYNWASALVMLVPEAGRGPYTREERKHKWPDIARRYAEASRGSWEEDQALCDALELATGEAWETGTIHGCCQGDWQQICYPVKHWSREALDTFETEYFNTGSEWIIHDGNTEPDGPEDIDGFSCYCHGRRTEDIKKEIAEVYGAPDAEVILYEFAGYSRITQYREVKNA